MFLKQSTAVTEKFGPFVDDADAKTAETSLTIQKADVRLSKNGGNMAAASADQGASDVGAPHDELGYYDVSLDTTDTGTLGRLKAMVSKSGALAVWREWLVLPANVYDALVGGSDLLQVDTTQVGGTAQTAGDLKASLDIIDDLTDELETRLTAGRASNLDNLDVAVSVGPLDLAAGVETGLTLRQALRLMAAALAGKLSGAGTTTVTIRNAVADGKDRIVAQVDSDGNRSAITYDLS